MTKIKVIDLEKLWNFAAYNLFIWNDLLLQNVNFEIIEEQWFLFLISG